jgi:F-type H+-transporting ATPase subunit delta
VIAAAAFIVAERYARALLDVALDESHDEGDADTIERELTGVRDLLESNPKLAEALSTPAIAAENRVAVLDEVLARLKLSAPTTNLLRLLTSRERMSAFGLVVDRYRKLLLEHKQIQPGEVTSAYPLNDQQQKRLAESLGEALGKTMELEFSSDEELVGGLVVRVENRIFDASVIGQLERIKEKTLSGL